MKSYAGIGSRETPPEILQQMEEFAFLAAKYLVLRSGGAGGADTAFETGCKNAGGPAQIFLPWKNFNGNTSPLHTPLDKAHEIAASIHPNYRYMRHGAKLLIARNMHQILGEYLDDPVDFVVCWTKDGCQSHETYTSKTGGTGSAIAVASKAGIPIFNLQRKDRLIDVHEHLMGIMLEKKNGG